MEDSLTKTCCISSNESLVPSKSNPLLSVAQVYTHIRVSGTVQQLPLCNKCQLQKNGLIIKSKDNSTLAKLKCIWNKYTVCKTMRKKLILLEDIKLYLIKVVSCFYLKREDDNFLKFKTNNFFNFKISVSLQNGPPVSVTL